MAGNITDKDLNAYLGLASAGVATDGHTSAKINNYTNLEDSITSTDGIYDSNANKIWNNLSNEELQIIDQPIFTNELCKIIYPLGYYIHFLKSYSIYTTINDYQIVILKRKLSLQNLEKLEAAYLPPLHQRVLNKLRYLSRGLK